MVGFLENPSSLCLWQKGSLLAILIAQSCQSVISLVAPLLYSRTRISCEQMQTASLGTLMGVYVEALPPEGEEPEKDAVSWGSLHLEDGTHPVVQAP